MIIAIAIFNSQQDLEKVKTISNNVDKIGESLSNIEQYVEGIEDLSKEAAMQQAELKNLEYVIALGHPENYPNMIRERFNLYLTSFSNVKPGDEVMIDDPAGGTYPYTVEEIEQHNGETPITFIRLRRYENEQRSFASAVTVYPTHFIMTLTTPRGVFGVAGNNDKSVLIHQIEHRVVPNAKDTYVPDSH